MALLYLLGHEGEVAIERLPRAAAAVANRLPAVIGMLARPPAATRGRDVDDRRDANDGLVAAAELFDSLFPSAIRARVLGAKRVFLAAHRDLHRLPFEVLVTEVENGKPVHWIDRGPPIAYVPSGSVLCWLRQRGRDTGAAEPRFDIVALADPEGGRVQAVASGHGPLSPARQDGGNDRIRVLPRLPGARAEAQAIVESWAKQGRARLLLGSDATEAAVFELAPQAKYLHFACHGIAEEFAGQSRSMLVLSRSQEDRPGEDGRLTLSDLVYAWKGHIPACRLVVLSACDTNVGRTNRDDAPQALPMGFLSAGALSVISTLWAVDDASTRELMIDFHERLKAGESDRLGAFTAARKALRTKYSAPFHWAPFLYIGVPE